MIKNIFLYSTILFLVTSCVTTKKNFVNNGVIVDKVKLTFIQNSEIYKAKGNIIIHKDSDNINFKFFGPLGIELIKGSYENSLNYFNCIENKYYTDIETVILNKYNFKINKKCFYFFLIGDIDSLFNEICKINLNNYSLNFFHSKDEFSIVNNFSSKYFKVLYKFRNNYPKRISIGIGDRNYCEYSLMLDFINN